MQVLAPVWHTLLACYFYHLLCLKELGWLHFWVLYNTAVQQDIWTLLDANGGDIKLANISAPTNCSTSLCGMLGRPRKQRRIDPSEPRKGTKISKVGTKMKCSLCRKGDHNMRNCPLNPNREKKNIKRKNRENDGSTTTAPKYALNCNTKIMFKLILLSK